MTARRANTWALAGGAWLAAAVAAAEPPAAVSFDRDVRPILSDFCFACHGPDAADRQAGLRLDEVGSATAPLDSGAVALVPGDAAASAVIDRVTSTDPDLVMPPPEAKLGRLSDEQVRILERWIAAGAAYETHWAFRPLGTPERPAADAEHPIDRLVSRRLADRGLALRPEADRATLIRRVTFDLTGLPPTPAEVDAFVADRAADAYDRLLDRLLASPRYGERMATDWMDLARYSDSYGFQVDRDRPMWPWRDWVISAFNRNLPWDEFTTWQLAGDLLPNATDEQLLATAFNRLHQQEAEGGSVEEEYRVAYVNDRTTTFGTAFLGLTLECCRCHDHKFDPLSQREYYQLFAFFDDVDEAGLYSYFTPAVPTPKMRLVDADARTALDAANVRVAEASAAHAEAVASARARVARTLADGGPLPELPTEIPGELVRYDFDERRPDGAFPGRRGGQVDDALAASSPGENTQVPGRSGSGVLLTGDHPVQTPVGNFRRSQPFTVSMWLQPPVRFERAVVFHRSQAWTDAGSRGYELLVADGHLRWSLIHFWPGDAASVRTVDPLPIGRWVHVTVTSDGSGTAAGLGIAVDGRPAATAVVRDGLTREITGGGGDHIRIGERMRDHGFKGGVVDDVRVFDRQLSSLEIRDLAAPGAMAEAIAARTDVDALGDLVAATDADVAARRTALAEARLARDDRAEQPAEIMVMREMPQPKTAYVLARGDYDKRGSAVEPDTPAVLPPFPAGQPRNRLGLARWLTAPDHPLLARVTVNRFWQALFGTGLVKSAEDLGSQAVPPEHPDLLDWLAMRFARPVAEGGVDWDVKALLKEIMQSRTYRQRSDADARTLADDPLNVWLARGPRHRLPAEMIRDAALAASGLLAERLGGPSVSTYDLPESFKPSPAGSGEALYRRSLYTFWRRTGPAPVLESFDVPKRVVCVARRDVTNTPLHAFVLLNGPQFVEAARVLAERLLSAHPADDAAMVAEAFLALTGRRPDETEAAILRRMHAAQREWYAARPDEAAKLLAVGERKADAALSPAEVAALTGVVNALLAYDGFVMKR